MIDFGIGEPREETPAFIREALAAGLEARSTELAAAEGRLAQLREGQAAAEAEADERRQALEGMRAELDRLAAAQAEAAKLVQELENRRAELGNQAEAMERQRGELAERIQAGRQELAGLRAERDGAEREFQERRSALEQVAALAREWFGRWVG
ncbi:MAG: hypothetical protein KY433_12775 [Actinobacteria bacterium]|nr:hypothetical protein [Actinomycetota bacterium]